MKQLMRKDEFPPLTGLRFVAVSMIFLLHYNWAPVFTGFWKDISNQLYLGVHLFFVLSGFLIAYKYYEPSVFKASFLKLFLIKRFARVYPLFFLLTTLEFIVLYLGGKTEGLGFLYLLNITFIKGFSSHFVFTGIFTTWSLTVEETFYLLAPLIFLVHKQYRVLVGQVLFFWLVGALLWWVFTAYPFHGFFKDLRFISMSTFFGRCFEFFTGIWLALYLKRQSVKPRKWPVYTMAGITGAAGIIIVQAWSFKQDHMTGIALCCRFVLSNILFPVFITMLIYGLICEASFVKKLLSVWFIQLLGWSSYAFFLVHGSVIATWIMEYVTGAHIALTFIVLYAISILLFFTVEQPLRTWINSKAGRKPY